ncbi:uncharacterized protein [Branchiostoma lanceolatum]|uniref:uncharacterized protein n=1 Tax=Branchiostoma lanceolatum TaxID=7740 RepID=UPI00345153AB
MSVAGATRTKKNQKEERGRGNRAYVDDEDILPPEQPNASEISKQKHNRKDTTYQADQSSEVTDVEVTMIGDVEQENSSPDGVDDTTPQTDNSPRYDDQSNVSETEKTGSGRHQEHEADIEADHDVEENVDQQSPNTDASEPTVENRDPENGQKGSETSSLKQHFSV